MNTTKSHQATEKHTAAAAAAAGHCLNKKPEETPLYLHQSVALRFRCHWPEHRKSEAPEPDITPSACPRHHIPGPGIMSMQEAPGLDIIISSSESHLMNRVVGFHKKRVGLAGYHRPGAAA